MSLCSGITRLPHAFDPDRGEDARSAATWPTRDLADLVAGAGGSAPYLKSLIEREAEWLIAVADAPDAGLAAVLRTCRTAEADQTATVLRQAKRRVALLTALCDLGGVWSLEQVTHALTDFADTATDAALRAALTPEIRRGKLPGARFEDLPEACGMVVLAMGKMGAHELNYSSDIDLICLFDETRFDPADFHDARASFVRATRKMAALLSELTADGYVFRTDLRLRPDPSVTPVCMAMEAAERYYESVGRTWERAAYIKARPCAGDLRAGARFLETLKPFVWRKHLDFAAIQDAHDMQLRIRDHRGLHGAITLPGHNMKLGRGGIREIEFFTQTRQLIAGGRDKTLRSNKTVEALGALAARDWVPQATAQTLCDEYRAHRLVEHRLQMIHDAQTHDLPKTDEGFDRLACLMGTDRAGLQADLHTRLSRTHDLTEGFFAPKPVQPADDDSVTGLEDHPVPARWPTYPALRSARATEIFARLRPVLLARLSQAAKPEEALMALDGFLHGLPAGVQVFSLLDVNPTLVDLLVDIVSTSPDLGRFLARNAAVFDAVIVGDFFADWPGVDALRGELAAHLHAEPDYERQLDLVRRWGKEWHFRAGVHLLRGMMDADAAGRAYADLAEATLSALWPVVQSEFARKHGAAPGRGAVVVGMGSLGAGRLHARSDLDMIMIYDAQDQEASEGPRPLPSRTYYARLTQAMITAMTAPMAEGRLYEVDMRLRPSGNKGPVATSWAAFQTYQSQEAWVWEHLALTRARVVAGPQDLARDVEAFRRALIAAPQDRRAVLGAVADMRRRIAGAKGEGGPWDAKLGPGRLQDIELLAQTATLLAGQPDRSVAQALARHDWLTAQDSATLGAAYALSWSLQVGARLVSDVALDPDALGAGGCAFLSRLTAMPDMNALVSALDTQRGKAAAIIDQRLPKAEEHG